MQNMYCDGRYEVRNLSCAAGTTQGTCMQYLGRFRREAFHGLEASGYVDTRIDPANVRRSGRTRQPTYELEFKPAPVTAAAECVPLLSSLRRCLLASCRVVVCVSSPCRRRSPAHWLQAC